MRILVVDDETDLANAIATLLRREGYAVDTANDGAEAREKLAFNEYDLVTLDLTLPDADGRDICREIRQGLLGNATVRVLMVTARDAIEERVGGLDEGADDYLVKPFALPELSARVRTLMRRETSPSGSTMVLGLLTLDTARLIASWDSVPIDLTTKEYALLRYFMIQPGVVLSQETLLEHVWDAAADPFTNTVRVTVGTLRRKLASSSGEALIETVIGAGYRLVEE